MDSGRDNSATWLSALTRALWGTRRRALVVIAVVALLTGLCGLVGRRIRVNDNLEALLSPTTPSVAALHELRKRQGAHDLLTVAIQSESPAAAAKLTERIATSIREWPDADEVFTDRDYTAIRNHALYLLETESLLRLRDRLARERQLAVARMLALDGDGSVDLDAVVVDDDWDADPNEVTATPANTAPNEPTEATDLRTLLANERAAIVASGKIPATDIDLVWPKENARGEIEWPEHVGQPFVSADGTIHLVQARLAKPATDLTFATQVNERIEALLAELEPKRFAQDMRVNVTGAYSSAREARAIIKDLRRATWLSGGLVVVVLLAAFRSVRAIVVVLAPLAAAIVVTLAIAQWMYAELSVLTAFLFAVLLGIGVDFAIHLYVQREAQGPTADWGAVLRQHLRPLASSMGTTFASFLVLLMADFRGFREFGLIAAIGVVVAFVVAVVLVPALDRAMGPLDTRRPTTAAPAFVARAGAHLRTLRGFFIAAAVTIAFLGAPRVGFEQDLRKVRAPAKNDERGIPYTRALAGKRVGTPIAVLADTPDDLDRVVDRLIADRETILVPAGTGGFEAGQPWIREVLSVSKAMPTQQPQKHAILREIHEQTRGFLAELPDLPDADPARKVATHLHALEQLSQQDPLTSTELPSWAVEPFRERDGTIDRMALMYVRLAEWDVGQIRDVTHRFRQLAGNDARGASARFVFADLAERVESAMQRMPPIALAVIFVLILADVRRVGAALAVFGTLCGGLALSVGWMGVFDTNINFYNLVVMPAVVGLGIDSAIHLWHARKGGYVATTNKAAWASAMTTAGAFAGLLVAEHPGLRSIGLVGVVSTLSCVAVAMLLLGWPRAPARMHAPKQPNR